MHYKNVTNGIHFNTFHKGQSFQEEFQFWQNQQVHIGGCIV